MELMLSALLNCSRITSIFMMFEVYKRGDREKADPMAEIVQHIYYSVKKGSALVNPKELYKNYEII